MNEKEAQRILDQVHQEEILLVFGYAERKTYTIEFHPESLEVPLSYTTNRPIGEITDRLIELAGIYLEEVNGVTLFDPDTGETAYFTLYETATGDWLGTGGDF